MKYHIFFERLYEKGNPQTGLISPFNLESLSDIDTNDSYFDKTLYKMAMPVEKQKGLNYVHQIERAITRLVNLKLSEDLIGFGGYGFDDRGNFYCDYFDGTAVSYNEALVKGVKDFSDERHIILKIDFSGRLSGSIVDAWGGEDNYLLKTKTLDSSNRHSSSAAIYACLCYIIARHEKGERTKVSEIMYSHYKDIVDGYTFADMATFSKAMRALDADFYTLFQYPSLVEKSLGELPINPEAVNYSDLDKVNLEDIGRLESMTGDSRILKGEKIQNAIPKITIAKKPRTVEELKRSGEYSLGMSLSKDDEDLIPSGFDAFIPSPITLDVAKEIKDSSLDPVPCRNILWFGETGTGKSTESQMLAVLLGLPYRSMNLSSDKLSSDLLVTCLPNSSKTCREDLEEVFTSFPDAGLIAVNPDEAYRILTGQDKKGVTEKEIIRAESDIAFSVLCKANDFMYVDSPFVEAFRNGGVIELQEANSCKAAILKSLNEALDDLNVLHLPTGEVLRRHKNCIVVVTANVGQGYEGINNFSNDFVARFHQADVFELPEDNILIERIKQRSGYKNETEIKKMIKVMHAIQRVLLETKGDYGSCSPRGLIAWARKTKNCGNAYLAGTKTIVGLATQDPEIRVELLHALETEFAPS